MKKARKYKVRTESPHDFATNPTCEGRIVKIDTIQVEKKDRLFMVIDTRSTLAQVFHSHALTPAFDEAEVGDGIRIVFHGKKKRPGGKTFNKFSAQVWEWSDEDDQEETDES